MTTEPLLMGIDGGQTATKAVLARIDGSVLATGRGGPFDHFHAVGGERRNRDAIHAAVRSALSAAGTSPDAVAAIALGLTGAFHGVRIAPIVRVIVSEILAPEHITVVPDFVTNLAGASGGEPGVVVIAGGGAIAYGVTADGREAIAGGFGYLLGDEGSAFDIGRRAVVAALRASDGRDPPTALESLVRSAFDLATMRDVTRVVYDADFSRDRLSLLAPLVAETARAGDDVARNIMTTAGQELAIVALAVIRRLFAAGDPVRVYLTGGVFGAGDVLTEPFRATLGKGWPEARAAEPVMPPVVGALLVARRSIGNPVDAAFLTSVAATMPT